MCTKKSLQLEKIEIRLWRRGLWPSGDCLSDGLPPAGACCAPAAPPPGASPRSPPREAPLGPAGRAAYCPGRAPLWAAPEPGRSPFFGAMQCPPAGPARGGRALVPPQPSPAGRAGDTAVTAGSSVKAGAAQNPPGAAGCHDAPPRGFEPATERRRLCAALTSQLRSPAGTSPGTGRARCACASTCHLPGRSSGLFHQPEPGGSRAAGAGKGTERAASCSVAARTLPARLPRWSRPRAGGRLRRGGPAAVP